MKILRVLAFLFLLSFGATLFFTQFAPEMRQSPEKVRIEITSGQGVEDIAMLLKREGLIRSSLLFQWYLRFQGADRSLRPGTFLFSRDATFNQLLDAFVRGTGQEVSVTIPEGYTIAQMDALLASMHLMKEDELLACAEKCSFSRFEFLPAHSKEVRGSNLEGYVFPDTYFVSMQGFDSHAFLERLLETFRLRIIEGLKTDLEAAKRPLEDVVIMASLIERETREDTERPKVAGILWKRLDMGTVLDTDATVRYAIGKMSEPLTKEDLESASPYNTRRHRGLPPGPIANPGLASITAALHPEASPYFYYLHGRDGIIHYAITNEAHNTNRVKYMK